MKNYELQEDSFVAGTTKTFRMYALYEDQNPIDLPGATAYFNLSDYVNDDVQVINKEAEVLYADGARSVISATLDSNDTRALHGKYIYQFMVIDNQQNVYCAKGLLTVWKNINGSVYIE